MIRIEIGSSSGGDAKTTTDDDKTTTTDDTAATTYYYYYYYYSSLLAKDRCARIRAPSTHVGLITTVSVGAQGAEPGSFSLLFCVS